MGSIVKESRVFDDSIDLNGDLKDTPHFYEVFTIPNSSKQFRFTQLFKFNPDEFVS